MDPALRAAATGMMAQQTRTEVIANNLATSAVGSASAGGAWLMGSTLFQSTVYGNRAASGAQPSSAGGVRWSYANTCQGSIIWSNRSSAGTHAFVR